MLLATCSRQFLKVVAMLPITLLKAEQAVVSCAFGKANGHCPNLSFEVGKEFSHQAVILGNPKANRHNLRHR